MSNKSKNSSLKARLSMPNPKPVWNESDYIRNRVIERMLINK